MIGIDVRDNIADVRRQLTSVQAEQLPYAVSLALNDTIFAVRSQIVGATWRQAFPEARNTRFPGVAFRVDKASKRNLVASLFDRLGRANLALHAKGGIKTPRGRALAVPIEGQVRRGARGVVASQRPRALMGRADTFVDELAGGGAGIWRRTRSGRKLLYVFKASVPIVQSFDFYPDASAVARREFPAMFARALARALATAR